MITVISQLMAQAYLTDANVISRKLPEDRRYTTEIIILMPMQKMNMHNFDAFYLLFHNKIFLQRYQITLIWYYFNMNK